MSERLTLSESDMKCIGSPEDTKEHLDKLIEIRDRIVLALEGKVILNGYITRKELKSALKDKELEIEMNSLIMENFWGVKLS